METKQCSKCGGIKSIKEFHKMSAHKSGYYPQCKECRKLAGSPVSKLEAALKKLEYTEFQKINGLHTCICKKCGKIKKRAYDMKNICLDCYNNQLSEKAQLKPLHKSSYRGVSCIRKSSSWLASIYLGHDKTHRIICKTEIEAAKAYNQYVIDNNLNRPLNIIESDSQ